MLKQIFAAAAFAGISLFAAESMSATKCADFDDVNAKIFSDSENGLRLKGTGWPRIVTKKAMPVAADKNYEVSFRYRTSPGAERNSSFYIGLVCFDKNNQEINVRYVNAFPGTDTELAAPVKKGDKIIKIKDGSKWKGNHTHVAFNAKKDYSDLPNFDISPLVKNIENKDGVWELTLATPMTKDYPAGTAVRRHADGGTYRYVVGNQTTSPEWKSVKQSYKGIALSDQVNSGKMFRAGTGSVRFVVFPNGATPYDMEIADLTIAEK